MTSAVKASTLFICVNPYFSYFNWNYWNGWNLWNRSKVSIVPTVPFIQRVTARFAIHNEMTILVDRCRIAGLDHRCRGHFLDDRGPLDHVAAQHLRAVIDDRVGTARAFEDHRSRSPARVGRRCFFSLSDLRELRFAQSPDRGYAQAHDVGGFFRRAVAVAQLMRFIEKPFDLHARGFVADFARHAHGASVLLAAVAHIGRASAG